MKQILILLLVFTVIFSSCKKEDKNKENEPVKSENKIVKDSVFTSIVRPNEKLKLGKVMTDDFEFINYNDNGDYFYVFLKKGNQEIAMIYDWKVNKKRQFNRGDIIRVDWKIDSMWVSGDGESLHFEEWAKDAHKIKDGKVSLFKKKFKTPLSYHYSEEFSTVFLDEIYTLVEYYLANSKRDLVRVNLEDPNAIIEYSIENRNENGKEYVVIGIKNNSEGLSSIMQWLYIENGERLVLYEYDLGNEKLIEFK